jgi:hypothetical protein
MIFFRKSLARSKAERNTANDLQIKNGTKKAAKTCGLSVYLIPG